MALCLFDNAYCLHPVNTVLKLTECIPKQALTEISFSVLSGPIFPLDDVVDKHDSVTRMDTEKSTLLDESINFCFKKTTFHKIGITISI